MTVIDEYKKELIKIKKRIEVEIIIAERPGDREYCTFRFKDDRPFFCKFLAQVAPPQCELFNEGDKNWTNLEGCKITGNILRCQKCIDKFGGEK